MRVGFVGTGAMGGPMLARVVAAGHDAVALARSASRLAEIEERGARAVTSVADVARGAHVVVVCVFDDAQVRAVCGADGLADALEPGAVLVLHTTGHPGTATDIAELVRDRRVAVIDAPVSGGPHDISAGSITVFAGGPDEALEAARPVIGTYADPILHTGPTGSGQTVKLINNALFAANIGLISEAVALGGRLGVDESALVRALAHGSSASRALSSIAAGGSVGAFTERVGAYLAKDVSVVRSVASDLGTGLGGLDAAIDSSNCLTD